MSKDDPDTEERTVVAGGKRPEVKRSEKAYFVVLTGTNVGEMFKLDQTEMTIGRSRNASITLIDDGISRSHARVIISGDTVVIEDLKSSNGTFCNNRLIDKAILRDGDKIQIGQTTILKFTYQDHLEETFQQQMYDAAVRDALTQTYNKRFFLDRLEGEFHFAKRREALLAVLMLDVDYFKKLNDEHGHVAGDLALAAIGRALNASIRAEDMVARYGGEEFAILLRATPLEGVVVLAERLRQRVEQIRVNHNHMTIGVTASIGIATVPEIQVEKSIMVVEKADEALYEAKRKGRNRVVLHPSIPFKP